MLFSGPRCFLGQKSCQTGRHLWGNVLLLMKYKNDIMYIIGHLFNVWIGKERQGFEAKSQRSD